MKWFGFRISDFGFFFTFYLQPFTYFTLIRYTAIIAVNPPTIVDTLGCSPRKNQLKTTALDGTKKTNELALCEPSRFDAKKYTVVARPLDMTERYIMLNQKRLS